MKLCVFSDIHGNLPAFEAAYPLIINESADVNLFLGDLCGYYFDEVSVWQRLRDVPRLVALRGNHDEMFLRAADGDARVFEESVAKYGPAIKFFFNKDYLDMISWIRELPISWESPGGECVAYHGSPWDALNEYVYPNYSLKRFKDIQKSFVFLGHTHYPMDKIQGTIRIVNPGSLGQPRDGGWPRFVVVDTESGGISFREVVYDKKIFACEVRKIVPDNAYLYDVIERSD